MRRFKKKFGFAPYHVKWILAFQQFVYRQERRVPFVAGEKPAAEFYPVNNPMKIFGRIKEIERAFGLFDLMKMFLSVATPSREFYCLVMDGKIVNCVWIMFSRCRRYHVERGDAVLNRVWTDPGYRGKGLSKLGLKSTMNAMIKRGRFVFYIDTAEDNIAMQEVIAECDFGPPVAACRREGR
jgi:GNAT superfamily N-acetyltransferase